MVNEYTLWRQQRFRIGDLSLDLMQGAFQYPLSRGGCKGRDVGLVRYGRSRIINVSDSV